MVTASVFMLTVRVFRLPVRVFRLSDTRSSVRLIKPSILSWACNCSWMVISDQDFRQLPRGCRYLAEPDIHYAVKQGRVKIADGAGDLGVPPKRELFLAARHPRDHAARFVR